MQATGTSLVAIVLLGLVLASAGRTELRARVAEPLTAAAAGVSVAYVFVVLFPELAHFQAAFLEHRAGARHPWLHEQVFLLALAGMLLLGGARLWATRKHAQAPAMAAPFKVELATLCLVSAFVGFTLSELARAGVVVLGLATLGYGTHLLVEVHALRAEWAALYRRTGRWLLLACLAGGWITGALWGRAGTLLAAAYALVSGSIIASAMGGELPRRTRRDFIAFVGGALAFTALVLGALRLVRT